jgi:hypothetical protein
MKIFKEFSRRPWTDAEKWAMGILSALIIAAITGTIVMLFDGKVRLTIASDRDDYGRCIDTELFIENHTKTDAKEIVISFDVDHFTRKGYLELEYGDRQDEMISPAKETLLPKKPFVPVEYSMDGKLGKLTIPNLKPGEYLHIFYGGEVVLDLDGSEKRAKLLREGDVDLMNKPRVASAVRRDGTVSISRVRDCRN